MGERVDVWVDVDVGCHRCLCVLYFSARQRLGVALYRNCVTVVDIRPMVRGSSFCGVELQICDLT